MWATSAHPSQLNGWKQTLWIYWLVLRGPTSGTGSHLHSGGPRGPGTSGWRHGSKTIMMRLVWAWAQSPGAIASHPLSLFLWFMHIPPFFLFHSPCSSFSVNAFLFLSPSISLHLSTTLIYPSLLSQRLFTFPPWHTQTHFLGSYAFQKVQEAPCTKRKNWTEQQDEY